MAISKTTKSPATSAKPATTTSPVVTAPPTSAVKSDALTVVVLDSKSHPVQGARVSIEPSTASAVTNSSGEVQFKLGIYTKYQVTVSEGSNTVTVPYYVTTNGTLRLIVNASYVKSVEAQLHQSTWSGASIATTIGIVLAAIIVLAIIWRLLKGKRSRR